MFTVTVKYVKDFSVENINQMIYKIIHIIQRSDIELYNNLTSQLSIEKTFKLSCMWEDLKKFTNTLDFEGIFAGIALFKNIADGDLYNALFQHAKDSKPYNYKVPNYIDLALIRKFILFYYYRHLNKSLIVDEDFNEYFIKLNLYIYEALDKYNFMEICYSSQDITVNSPKNTQSSFSEYINTLVLDIEKTNDFMFSFLRIKEDFNFN